MNQTKKKIRWEEKKWNERKEDEQQKWKKA